MKVVVVSGVGGFRGMVRLRLQLRLQLRLRHCTGVLCYMAGWHLLG